MDKLTKSHQIKSISHFHEWLNEKEVNYASCKTKRLDCSLDGLFIVRETISFVPEIVYQGRDIEEAVEIYNNLL